MREYQHQKNLKTLDYLTAEPIKQYFEKGLDELPTQPNIGQIAK